MENITGNSVGIDYHTESVQVQVMGADGTVAGRRRCRNSISEVREFVVRYGDVCGVAIEACTGSAVFAEELRKATQWKVSLCHPGYVQRMRHNPDKSDKSDAYLLSDLNRVGYLPEVWLAPEEIRDLRTMVRYRKQLTNQRAQIKLRIRAILRQQRVKAPPNVKNMWTKRGIAWLKSISDFPEHTSWVFAKHLAEHDHLSSLIKEADARITVIAEKDSMILELAKKKGIGLFTASVIRAEIGTFSRFSNGKQLSRFCGVSPRNCSSGERQADARLIKAGNCLLKTVVIEATHLLVRHDPEWKKFAARLISKGKPYSVAIGATANRWLRKLYYEMVQIEQQPCPVAA